SVCRRFPVCCGALDRSRGAPALIGGFFELRVDDAFVLSTGTAGARTGAAPRRLLSRRHEPRSSLRQLLGTAADQGGIVAAHCRTKRRDSLFHRASVGLID